MTNEYAKCPICGEPIDYCQGHGAAEDPCCEHCGEGVCEGVDGDALAEVARVLIWSEDDDGVWVRLGSPSGELCGPYPSREDALLECGERKVVHSEPCAVELMNDGWEIA